MKAKKEEKKVKIAFYTLSMHNNGVFKIISTLTLNMPEIYSTHVFISDSHNKDFKPSFNLGGKIHYFNIVDPDKRNFLNRIYKNYLRKKLLKKHKLENNIDLTITFSENPNIHNIITKGKSKAVIAVHNYTSKNLTDTIRSRFYKFFYEMMIKKYFNKSDKIIAISHGIKMDLINNFSIDKNKITVLYNPHDLNNIIELSEKPLDIKYNSLFHNSFSLINIGRISTQKGHWNLIRSFSLVKKEIPEANLIIMGDANEDLMVFIKKLISDFGLEKSVNILGFQTNPYNFLKKSDVYVSSSIYEGLPNVLIEALACSTPVISSDCKSGPREILAPSTDFSFITNKIEFSEFGILTPPFEQQLLNYEIAITQEEKFLADAIIELYQNKDLRESYSQKGPLRAADFSTNKIIQNYNNLFRDILKK